jgi:hypothetical protein
MECRRSGSHLGRWLTSPQLEECHGCSVGGAQCNSIRCATIRAELEGTLLHGMCLLDIARVQYLAGLAESEFE